MDHSSLGTNIKKLGFGYMRLPQKDGEFDIALLNQMADKYLAAGFSYFDTSPVYGMGQSESVFRRTVVERHPRESFQIATKLPMWTIDRPEGMQEKFDNSLKNLGVDYIDFYLLHGLSGVVSDRFPSSGIDKANRMGAWEFLKKCKAEGKAKHIGFSYHDSAEVLDRILTDHPEAEFVQLQINYADWEDEVIQSRKCYEVAMKHGVPVIVMEPCKGGTLVEVRQDVAEILQKANPAASLASWAIRYSASLDGVLTVLSGMSTIEMMEDNISYMENFQPLTDAERAVLDQAKEKLESVDTIPCTGCRYCVEGCPKGIRIPDLFKIANNEIIYEGKGDAVRRYVNITKTSPKASECVKCKKCENSCPQHLPITELLERVAKTFEGH